MTRLFSNSTYIKNHHHHRSSCSIINQIKETRHKLFLIYCIIIISSSTGSMSLLLVVSLFRREQQQQQLLDYGTRLAASISRYILFNNAAVAFSYTTCGSVSIRTRIRTAIAISTAKSHTSICTNNGFVKVTISDKKFYSTYYHLLRKNRNSLLLLRMSAIDKNNTDVQEEPFTITYSNETTTATTKANSKNVRFSIVWILLLLFIAWPLAKFCSPFWTILQPFEAVFKLIEPINNFLEKIITWPRQCGTAIMNCSSSFPSPF